MKTATPRLGFRKGWDQLRGCDREQFREEAMKICGLKNKTNFYSRMNGKTNLAAVEYVRLTALFQKYGVEDPYEWL